MPDLILIHGYNLMPEIMDLVKATGITLLRHYFGAIPLDFFWVELPNHWTRLVLHHFETTPWKDGACLTLWADGAKEPQHYPLHSSTRRMLGDLALAVGRLHKEKTDLQEQLKCASTINP